MNNEVFQNIGKIIERDSKATTYKFALLRGVIDIIQENSPFIKMSQDRVRFPLGLLIQKWMLYYYPILESSITIPQINGATNIAFRSQLLKIISAYKTRGGFSAFYNDLKNKGIPRDLHLDFLELSKKLRSTITTMPMKYIGRSINDNYYSIFQYDDNKTILKSKEIDLEFLINSCGSFSISFEYYEAFALLGSFISSQDSILFRWAEFSVNASKKNLSIEKVVNEVLKSPITEREIKASKSFYEGILQKQKFVECVWTGDNIKSYNVDHVIPFSVWKNNDLWNLLPSRPSTNNKKRDKIPTSNFIETKRCQIINYWNLINEHHPKRFQKEIKIALLGNHSQKSWQDEAIEQLKKSCNYLIVNRGFQEWKI